ncbi:histidinol-phosphate transaminase [Seongchinamella sediminis]|uniref:Histidinol-phosphate aminotransferase n=1 Tax=Seongchinamella sediminis TaxID=2283635 RepID=A0A3L7E3H5_9GAMM|nr:histidinol-phosphate transaminase [Seongchinamella sediminis]RLQ22961.1 histidinol-phosphate transaminase [Seongchinamella sediminis]
MSRFWTKLAAGLSPYVPGEQPRGERLVKLNTNENPYPPAPGVLAAIAGTSGNSLRRYPDPDSSELRAAFARREGLSPGQVFLGNGSDEVLAHTFQGLLKHERPLAFPDISYSFYPVWSALYEIEFTQVPLTADFRVDVQAFPQDCGSIIIPNPNAPTGVLLGLDEIRQLLRHHADAVVVIDEAYIDFGGESATRLIPEHDNLLVVQTASKSRSLAGLRVGAAFGQEQLIEALVRIKDSFNSYPMDVVSQRAMLASLADEQWFSDCCERVIQTRERTATRMQALGFAVLPSAANFLFASHPQVAAGELFAALRERQIIVRYFDKPRISEFLRISIGTDEDMDAMLRALEDILA